MRKRIFIALIIVLVIGGISVALWVFLHQNKPSDQTALPPPKKDPLVCVDALPADIKITQKLMVAAYSDLLDSETPVFTKTTIGGVIIMDQTPAAKIKALRESLSISPTIAIDQEGGSVQRYTEEGELPGAKDMAAQYTASQAYDLYSKDATFLKGIGITTNFAPVVDVESQADSPLPGRIYSNDPNVVANYATRAIKASKAAGITPVIKHFPGLGSATGNTDYGSASTNPLAALEKLDLLPYTKLATLSPDVMVSNAIVPDLTNGEPAVWSSAAINLLRNTGYQKAVVYTDSLTAKAIPGTLADAVVKAWQAGNDVSLIVQTRQDTPGLEALLDEIIARAKVALRTGELKKEDFSQSVARILARKGSNPCDIHLVSSENK